MIERGDNFRVLQGEEAAVSLAAWMAMKEATERQPVEATSYAKAIELPHFSGKRWSEDDERRLKEMWRDYTDHQLAILFDRTEGAIKNRRVMLGLVPRPIWS